MFPTTVPLQHNETRWYYQDPQGKIQGPLTSSEMLHWFNAGYFSMSLMIRRSCDENFLQLGDFIKLWGCIPFLPGSGPPPVQVQMEDVDKKLKMNIRSILPSASEETVDGIIHALKYVGLETISDLPYIKEEDLILVLKPIQRRKLIKAWQEQFNDNRKYNVKTLDLSNTLGGAQDVAPSSAVVPSHQCAINWADAMENEDLNSKNGNALQSSNMPLFNCTKTNMLTEFRRKLLQTYVKHAEFASSDTEEKVWENIARELREKYSYVCNISLCQFELSQLKLEYENLIKDGVKSENMVYLFDDAKQAFETFGNPAVSLVNNSPPKNLSLKKCTWNRGRCLKLLKMCAYYKINNLCPGVDDQTVWKKIAAGIRTKKFQPDELECRTKIEELRCEYERIKSEVVKERYIAIFLDTARRVFEGDDLSPEKSQDLPDCRKRKTVKIFRQELLQVYAEYEAEFDNSDIGEEIVWKKIVKEMRKKYYCGESLCRFELSQVKCQNEKFHEDLKNESPSDEAREVVEISEKLDVAISKKVGKYIPSHLRNGENRQTVPMMPLKAETVSPANSLSLEKYSWSRNRVLKLLKVCAEYKTNLLQPRVEDPTVWERIAAGVRKLDKKFNCDALDCCTKIEELKCQYERFKSETVKDRNTAIILDESQKVFGTVNLSVKPSEHLISCKKTKRSVLFRQKLLEVYSRYKTEFANPDIDKQTVWQKIVANMREKYDCGESLCRFELSEVKCEYEKLRREDIKNRRIYFYLDLAKEVFGSFTNLEVPSSQLSEINKEVGNFSEVPNSQVSEISKKVGKYVPPHLRNEKNSQDVPVMPLQTENKTFTIKVSNFSKDVRASDLQEFFETYGTIADIYIIKDLEDTSCKHCAFIRFHNKEDASRAILAVDGTEYSWKDESDLRVEWAESSEINGISE